MKLFLKLPADLSNSFSPVPLEHLQLLHSCCLLASVIKEKSLDSPFISMITSTQFPCWTPLTLLYLYFVKIIQVITLCSVIRISEKVHLYHVFQYHYYVSSSQFCISILVLCPEYQDQTVKQMGTITHICPSPPETSHVQNWTHLLPVQSYSSFYFPSAYSLDCTLELSFTHPSPLLSTLGY